jgi:hypothetical protein
MTAPMDDNVDKWHTIKQAKYRDAVSNVHDWTFHDLDIEVGALGWIPPSTRSQLTKLGFLNKEVTALMRDLQYLARKCSYVISLNRFNKDFRPWRLTVPTTYTNADVIGILDTKTPVLIFPASTPSETSNTSSSGDKEDVLDSALAATVSRASITSTASICITDTDNTASVASSASTSRKQALDFLASIDPSTPAKSVPREPIVLSLYESAKSVALKKPALQQPKEIDMRTRRESVKKATRKFHIRPMKTKVLCLNDSHKSSSMEQHTSWRMQFCWIPSLHTVVEDSSR